jgi:DNA polymerase III delta prime subunit
MALRGKKPALIQKRLKVLFYGQAGVGKTTAAINFPKPYLVDTERGCENDQYVKILEKNGGVIFQTTDFDDLLDEVRALLTTKHDYKTLIIDPLTTLYSDLCEKWAIKLAKQSKDPNSDGMEFQRHRDKADIQIKHLFKLLLRLDMNVIITSHLKTKWKKIGGELTDVGNTFNCYKDLDYLFDLTLEIERRGKERIAIVKKTRLEGFSENEQFPFCYEAISNKYGKSLIEKEAVPEILANSSQILELKNLVELLKIPEETQQKWLDKAKSETWEEMPAETIQKCIDALSDKLTKRNAA